MTAQPLKRLTHIAYNVNEGLLQSQVMHIAEDGNGFTWVSSSRGIQRFDGRHFHQLAVTTSDKGIPDEKDVNIFPLQNGNLLFSGQHYISEYDIHRNRFRILFKQIPTPAPGNISVLSEEKDKIWYWIPRKGITALDKVKQQPVSNIPVPAFILTNMSVSLLTVPGDNNCLVFLLFNKIYFVNKLSGKMDSVTANGDQQRFFSMAAAGKDSILVATGKGIELLNCHTQRFEFIAPYQTNPFIINPQHPVQIMTISPNTCIIGEGREVFELDITQRRYTARLVDLQNQPFVDVGYITKLFTDQHDNIWLLTENDGIYKINYRQPGFGYFGDINSRNNFVKTILVDKSDNRVLCGIFGGGLQVFDTAKQLLKSITQLPGVTHPPTVSAFRKAGPHRYLVFAMGTWQAWLLNTVDYSFRKIQVNTSKLPEHLLRQQLPDYHLSLHAINDSLLLMQSSFHIYHLKWSAHSASLSIQAKDSFDFASVSSYLDHRNRLWVGSYGMYYLYEQDAPIKKFSLPGKTLVRCFYDNSSGGTWMGTEKGLMLLNENGEITKTYRIADGLIDENIYAVRMDKQHNTWFSHNKGISCRKPDGSFLHYSKKDGLQENEFNTNTSYETPDGEFFFGGVNGISSFYPSLIASNNETPAVLLTGIRVRDKAWKEDTAYWAIDRIELPHYDNTISFDMTAMGVRSPDQYNYQYHLVNHDPGWVNAGNNPHARYVLQPGRYVFRYYAGNSFEQDPANAREITIVIKPPFWRTGWFITGIILLFITVIVLLTRYASQVKLKKKIDELQRKRMMDEERLRISREMHDDIGAGLTQITLMSEAAKRETTNTGPLNEIANMSRQLVGSMSEIIWSLNPGNNTVEQLLSYLREQVNKLLEYSGIRYTIDFPDNGRAILLNNAQRRNLLLVTKEIVHNAIKHSKAANIAINCSIDGNRLSFTVSDDGKGFDTAAKSNGNGLRNIRRRIEELNGILEIKSSPLGTIFHYSTPA
jgi:signal transduction histidine kinase/ligand-binding sensor domain-containing protein